MPWVLAAVENHGIHDDDDQAVIHTEPSWLTAYSLCPHPQLSEPLYRLLEKDARLRDSVGLTMSKAVTPWVRLGLSQSARPLSTYDQLSLDSFDPDMLDDPDATLFVIAPNTGTVAGAAVSLIDSIIQRFRQKTANHQLTHRLLLELDEVCNSCPLPNLLTYIGESAGLGVNILATVQASSHFDVVYGPKYADALRDMFPGTLIMYGAHERHILEQASHWLGETTRRTESYEPNHGARSQSSQFGQMIGWQELLPQNREEAQLLQTGITPTLHQGKPAHEQSTHHGSARPHRPAHLRRYQLRDRHHPRRIHVRTALVHGPAAATPSHPSQLPPRPRHQREPLREGGSGGGRTQGGSQRRPAPSTETGATRPVRSGGKDEYPRT
jgi:hypothetical protein